MESLQWLELPEQKIKETLKNANLTMLLQNVVNIALDASKNVVENGALSEFAGRPLKNKKTLLYNLATRLKPQSHHHIPAVVRYIMSGGIANESQLTAAVDYLLHHSTDAALDAAGFEDACGVGVEVSAEQIEDEVRRVVEMKADAIRNERYSFNTGRILTEVKQRLRWADGGTVKRELDIQMLLLLGPKNADDLLPSSSIKKKGTAGASSKIIEKSADNCMEMHGEARPSTNNASASPPSPGSEGDAKDEAKTVNSIDELLAERGLLHQVGENWKTDGYVTTPNTMGLLSKHCKEVDGNVRTRFPPEPNGILHIGHAKAININFGYAKSQGGKCILRFDDTNPEKEEEKFFLAIEEMVRWLGFEPWKITHSSDYFDQLYEWAVKLIEKGLAYVCHQSVEEMRGFEVKLSSWRDRPVEESLKLFQQMRDGVFDEGEATLRLKLTLEEGKVDPVAYRIKYLPHHRTKDKWCIYPTYDYTHCLCDSIENITHSLCTKEFQNRRSSYYWLCNALDIYCPVQWEYSRLNMCHTVVSKRKILKLIEEGIVGDWDDPRLFTLTALRRRGIPPECINKFIAQLGVTVALSSVEPAMLEAVVRDHLNVTAPRTMAVLEPLKIIIENYAELSLEERHMLKAPYFPADKECDKFFEIPFTKCVYIERADFQEQAEKGYRRLTKAQTVGLKHIGLVLTYAGEERDTSGALTGLKVTAKTLGDAKKPKAFIHWVADPVRAEVRLYDRLFNHKNPEDVEQVPSGYICDVNPDSLTIHTDALIDRSIADAKEYDRFQFERTGYFCVDRDSNDERLVFNRIVSLREDPGKTI